MLTLSSYRKAYAGRTILAIPHLALNPGVHWLKGANGSGKTTLFRTLAGLLPFEGDCLLENTYSLKKHPVEYRLRVNYGEAEPLYPDFLTARELINWVAAAKKAPRQQPDELIHAFGMNAYAKTPVGTYSSGMLKKTSLVLAFLGQPKLILLDEPFITLDEAAVRTVLELMEDGRKRGVGFLLSTHQDVRSAALAVDAQWQISQQTVIPFRHEASAQRSE
ncbi:ABC transporter ATP-binding protein [Tellurirhabdus rosea]|uniref:ABC transporter ATP-binding protein n=1 Tax=Tellurirhabdus rosea TaxID=2674997 RepID=UPI002259B288|nr:ABC transporter ATP-binding protein [Tellurirhabdus rosea]